jgi:hypothetical protein
VGAGRVIVRSNQFDGYGYKVVVDHGTGHYSVYAHFRDPAYGATWGPGIEVGVVVPQGQLLGYAGDSGGEYPVHLHFHMQSGMSAYNSEPLSGVFGFRYYGNSVEYDCAPSPNDPSDYWASYHPETDGDLWWDNHEQYYATSPWLACNFTTTLNDEPDNWPPDFNDNRVVDILDVMSLKPFFNGTVPPVSKRYDLSISGNIDILDVLALQPFFNETC